MKLKLYIFTLLAVISSVLYAHQYNFDTGTVAPFQPAESGKAQLSIVNAPYKDGNAALQWSWSAPTSMLIDYQFTLNNFRNGVIFWVYNEIPRTTPLVGEFRDASNNVRYYFNFGLNFKGWRICRIGSRYMEGNKSVSTNLKLRLQTPSGVSQGRLFIDRFSFVADVNYQNAPDAQQPNNNEAANITHWNSLWKWESQLTYDLQLPTALNATQLATLQALEQGVVKRLPQAAISSVVTNAKTKFTNSGISKTGSFWVGTPLVVKPDQTSSDISFAELGSMMYGLALDAVYNGNQTSAQQYIDLWEFAMDQGFAYGSAMGNNHHYGYDTRQIFVSAYLMRETLNSSGRINEVAATLSFWSGLPESRRVFDQSREGVVDSWNTLLFARLISAMLIQDLPQRYRAVQSLVRWVDTSLAFTPGNMGGLKPDGTIFHHAGHYPAYGIGGFSGLGDFIAALPGSEFNLTLSARQNLAEALFAMSRYTHLTDWSIGMSGRHPHEGGMSHEVIESFGLLALLGGVYNTSESIDSKLAGEYLRLETENTALKQQLSSFTTGAMPSGFFVFNHAAAGVHRFGNNMVSIKGYNSDVWGSEIYTNDNRYGRYQSYGAVEIFNEGLPVSRTNSRFNEAGWDWNRLPGTTTIHLPLNLLESPVTSTLMARSKEDFAGSSSLLGQYGIFAMKLREENMINNTNYTRNFVARKSVFAFDKRMVCIGTGISNSNVNYPTETTLYQQTINAATERMAVNGTFSDALGYSFDSQIPVTPTVLSDLSGNYYRVAAQNRVIVEGKEQVSKHNKTCAETRGNFLTARIEHGKNPVAASYEYMIMLKPTPVEQRRWNNDPGYRVLQADDQAHVVHDTISGVTAYVSFEATSFSTGLVRNIDAETLLMAKYQDDSNITLSVCDPSLRLPLKTNNSDNTTLEGVAVTREILLDGSWQLKQPASRISISHQNNQTKLSVTCQLGTPVEFELHKLETSVKNIRNSDLKIITRDNKIEINGLTSFISVYDVTGKLLAFDNNLSEKKTFILKKGKLYMLLANLPDNSILNHKFYL